MLRLVHANLDKFTKDRGLLLGLVEDSVRGVSWWAPDVAGAEFVAGIAHWLLASVSGYGGKDARKRVLKVIAKIPKADAGRFEAILRGSAAIEGEWPDRVADEFRELIFMGMEGMPAARDLPDVVVSICADYLLASEEYLRSDEYRGSSIGVELYFGIKEELAHASYPASGIRGLWMHLLRHHPRKALDLFIKVFNHSSDWYAHPRLHHRLEPAFEIEITFGDGTSRKQWANPRLWGLYRGMSVGPHVLESMLMALENWLLDFAKRNPSRLDGILVDILRRSDSAALAAVVASVAVAHPHASGEALLALLSVRGYVQMDRSRMASERQMSGMAGMFPTLGVEHEIYEAERKQANDLPHRRADLEVAIANLQLGPLAARIQEVLDKHLAALPPKEEQSEGDLVWRLAIHRMDVRQYTVSEASGPVIPDTEGKPVDEAPRRYLRFDPKPPDADVQAMVDKSSTRLAATEAKLGLLMWGLHAFKGETAKHDSSQWAAKLDEARAIKHEADDADGSRHGPGFVAAVCLRDHWDEMSADQRAWCVEVVCAEVLQHAEQWGRFERVQRNPMAADRPSAFVLAVLLGKALPESLAQRVGQALAAAVTHPVDEVRWYSVWGVDQKVWASDRTLALRCVNAMAVEADLVDKAWAAERDRPYDERRQFDEITAEAAIAVRERFWEDGAIPDDAHVTVDTTEGFGADALARMLSILGGVPEDSLAVAAFARASRTLVAWWNSGDDNGHRRQRSYETESVVSERLQEFVLRTSVAAAQEVLAPVLEAIDRHAREIHWMVGGLTVQQDSHPNTAQYWFLWDLFAARVKGAKWVSRLADEHPEGSELLSAMFLTAYWKDEVRHWKSLEGYAHLVHSLFDELPPTSIVLDDYVRFLYHIGEQSLPQAFVRVAAALRRGRAQQMLEKTNSVFLLEVILQRHVYGRPLEVKRDAGIREAVLFILDCLVETGSSAAFRMRDDFVTPAG